MLLEHIGRNSGVVHKTVLEVVDHDPAFSRIVVCSGWGDRSDWYRNVVADPNVSFESKGVRHRGVARRVSAPDAELALRHYGARHPRALRSLAKRVLTDAGSEDTEVIAARVAAELPVLALIASQMS